MQKYLLLFLLVFAQINQVKAFHISGGEMYYTYLGKSAQNPNQLLYKITLVLYKDSTVTGNRVASLDSLQTISIYRSSDSTRFLDTTIHCVKREYMNLQNYSACLTNKPEVRYAVATYEVIVSLNATTDGFLVAHSQCCRVQSLVNVASFNPQIGVTYWVHIPGISTQSDGSQLNSSAYFNKKDTVLICRSSPLTLDFSATDPDNDSLSYHLSNAYLGSTQDNPRPIQGDSPPFTTIDFLNGYSVLQPFGTNITINNQTGIVTGMSPSTTGIYLIGVMVEEFKNGVKVGEHRKDFQVKVQDCTLTAAELNPVITNCNNLSISFENLSRSSNVTTYLWDFGDGFSSTLPKPTHNYADTGVYIAKLKVAISNGGCQDSTTTTVNVFPGFKVKLQVSGTCILNPFQFKDATLNKYGYLTGWKWDFGDDNTLSDTSSAQNPTYSYKNAGTKKVKLAVSSSKGCSGTDSLTYNVLDKPVLNLPFRDTLICSIDSLALHAITSTDSIEWTPNLRINNPTSKNPIVFPTDTTTYHVRVNENGCFATDSVKVNVLKFITVNAGTDTSICKTDSFRLHPVSDALSYKWASNTTEKVANSKTPLVQPLSNTIYTVTANLGKCEAKDAVQVLVYNYPTVQLPPDTTICFGASLTIKAAITGTNFTWFPTTQLQDTLSLQPTAAPRSSISYILTAKNAIGCLVPKSDTIAITVKDSLWLHAGNDTSVVIYQPLRLNAISSLDKIKDSLTYRWSSNLPNNELHFVETNSNRYNPTALFTEPTKAFTYTLRITDKQGCFADDAFDVLVYKVLPNIVVPSAFTPNNDGNNDVLTPIAVGLEKINYFNVYNRWGQLLFSTNEMKKGWSGNYNGIPQPSGTYVYSAQGIDYLGRTLSRTGTVVLIR